MQSFRRPTILTVPSFHLPARLQGTGTAQTPIECQGQDPGEADLGWVCSSSDSTILALIFVPDADCNDFNNLNCRLIFDGVEQTGCTSSEEIFFAQYDEGCSNFITCPIADCGSSIPSVVEAVCDSYASDTCDPVGGS